MKQTFREVMVLTLRLDEFATEENQVKDLEEQYLWMGKGQKMEKLEENQLATASEAKARDFQQNV